MQSIEVSIDNMSFLECLSSATRVRIIEMLNDRPMNIGELAEALAVSSAIITKHIQKMERAGIIACESTVGKRGMQKLCFLKLDCIHLQFRSRQAQPKKSYVASIPVGHYTNFDVNATCGLASASKMIGMVDDPRYFADPEHVQANLLWFGSGWVEYCLPNFLLSNQELKRLEISFEICSEAPGFNELWPSDISFFINGVEVGMWTSPGDFGNKRGLYTPDWWNHGTQHGLLKTIAVMEEGTYMDGVRISDVSVHMLGIEFNKEVRLRIASPTTADNCGGVTLFGAGYGNYDQDIVVNMYY
ncbi:ArsR family transcriptional regulator [Paenibacillus sp. UMB4589-SE434]|uniref:ArsR/SmtB family transcription factor n=1 Tax=Paenibacillus sp. UMB4589-SE434 TaxID=3046314 RepID=UPI002550158C|nr:ArsR family transcriptional regulator [Paenibacillus sp. UMB4589-SE434]MDK8180334.1 ArsR family transcriptional regulator [Paenibacillus sp. UMB4589-SE434]